MPYVEITNIITPDEPISDEEGMRLAEEIYDDLIREDTLLMINSFNKMGGFVRRAKAYDLRKPIDHILGVRPMDCIHQGESDE